MRRLGVAHGQPGRASPQDLLCRGGPRPRRGVWLRPDACVPLSGGAGHRRTGRDWSKSDHRTEPAATRHRLGATPAGADLRLHVVPTTRRRHVITETDQMAQALDDAAARWPADSANAQRCSDAWSTRGTEQSSSCRASGRATDGTPLRGRAGHSRAPTGRTTSVSCARTGPRDRAGCDRPHRPSGRDRCPSRPRQRAAVEPHRRPSRREPDHPR